MKYRLKISFSTKDNSEYIHLYPLHIDKKMLKSSCTTRCASLCLDGRLHPDAADVFCRGYISLIILKGGSY